MPSTRPGRLSAARKGLDRMSAKGCEQDMLDARRFGRRQRKCVPMSELPKPVAITKDRVVLTREGWNALIEALEDAEDRAAVKASIARTSAGEDDGLPAAFYRRLRAGDNPVRIW